MHVCTMRWWCKLATTLTHTQCVHVMTMLTLHYAFWQFGFVHKRYYRAQLCQWKSLTSLMNGNQFVKLAFFS